MERIETRFIVLIVGANQKERIKPAFAVADILRRRGIMSIFALPSNSQFIRAVSEKKYENVAIEKFSENRGWFGNFQRSLKRKSALKNTMKIFATKQIQAVLSLGGVTSLSALDVAQKMGIKTFLLEPNAVVSNWHSEFISSASRIYIPFEEMLNQVPKSKTLVTGVPVDPNIMTADKRNLPTNKKMLVIFTCRKDSHTINELVRATFRKYPELGKEFFILQETGEKDVASVQRFYDEAQIEALCYMQYENRGKYYKTSDLVVSRPTSDVVFELLAMRKQGIFIPLHENYDPFQIHNARMAARKDIAYVVEEGGSMAIRVKKFYSALNSFLIGNVKMQQNIDAVENEKAAAKVAADIDSTLSKKV
ncbi:MAG: UDP-N-acetylglucosamine--N-acetylmuramyl-(pentapeptide) pyrophosphoryl-undecaprenol N-acetylglucosamine transferase [bacterium]